MATFKNLVLLGIVCSFFVVTSAITDEEAMEVMTFLTSFGYLNFNNIMGPSEIKSSKAVERAVTNFQKFYNITVTGKMDSKTLEAMKKPRCGVPDPTMPNENGTALGGRLAKRYALTGGRWESSTVTYRILNYPRNAATRERISDSEVNAIIHRAFKMWSDYIPLTFQETTGYADIYLSFVSYYHGDYRPFDGTGNAIAHAYFPGTFLDGDIHFDDSERFTQNTQNFNLLHIAAHEIGHSLGLLHTNVYGALMYPVFTGYQPSLLLHSDDIRGIQAVYGSRTNPNPGGPRPTYTSSDVEGCNKIFTAVGYLRGEIFAFQKGRYWRIQRPGVLVTDIDGDLNTHFWYGLPDDVDAGYERWLDSTIIFFKGENYYLFNGNHLMQGPLPISEFTVPSSNESLPNNIDTVLTFGEYYKTYFFKDDLVWRYDEKKRQIDPGYPRPISEVFKGIPSDLSAAFRYKDGHTYFLKGKEYYRYNNLRQEADKAGFPRLFGVDFLACNTAEYRENTAENTGTAAVTILMIRL
ncbi:interstitial collagenase-like [Anneissia japonica]|uniref:interstitial collagenase-like n=1 Tax=Anneissia japonica TaxID=1529436 RepID=UPI001425502E|nr:interstitial collagenase-like [Anneissia japonica]